MELIVEEFMNTEIGRELEQTIHCWDRAIEERRKVTPGWEQKESQDSGLGFQYWENTCKSCQDRWEVFKLVIRHFYGLEFSFTRTDEYFGLCTDDEKIWLMKSNRKDEE